MTDRYSASRGQQSGPGRRSWRAGAWAFALCGLWMLAGAGVHATEQAGSSGPAQGQGERGIPGNFLVGHGGPVHAIKLNADKSRALTGSFDYSMMLWDLSGDKPKEIRRFADHDGWVKAVAFLPGEKRVLSAGGGDIWLWNLETGESLHKFKAHKAEITTLAVTEDGRWTASASSDHTVRLWNIETREAGPVLEGHDGPVNDVAFSLDGGTVYSASADGTIMMWDRETGEAMRVLYRHGFGVNALERVPDKDLLIAGALNGKAFVIDGKTGEKVHEFDDLLGPYLAAAVQEKPGLLALSGFQKKGGDVVGAIRVYRIGDWAPIEQYDDPRGPIWAMAFGPLGQTVYYGGKDDYVTVWQVSPRKPFEPIAGPVPRRYEETQTDNLGERQFARKCSLCHTLTSDGGNRAGPTLYKVFGRKAGTLPGYPYSDALKNSDIVWNEETIELLFGLGPDHYTPGTKMPLQRIPSKEKREALIAYLKVATEGGSGPGGRKSQDKDKTENKAGSREQ